MQDCVSACYDSEYIMVNMLPCFSALTLLCAVDGSLQTSATQHVHTQHSDWAVMWKRLSPGGTPAFLYTPSEPAHIRQGANHVIVDHVRTLPGAVTDRSVSMKGCGLAESSWVVLWRAILNKIYSRESACP